MIRFNGIKLRPGDIYCIHSRCCQTYLGMHAGLKKCTFFSEINEDKEIQPTHTEKEQGKMISDWDNISFLF